ncbi:MAG: ADOP family duplicated permease [Acidobacteria bacterium]|nr:ADOP family duplicated permease [Acidobacteriota bacterium]
MIGDSAALEAFRLLLRLYPGEFREEYGRELSLVFRDRLRGEGTATGWGIAFESFAGILREAPLEHVRIAARDLRLAWQAIRKDRLASGLMVLTLALALGANATMLGILDQLLLRPVPGVAEPGRVVRVYGQGYWTALTRSWPDFLDLRDHTNVFSGVAAFQAGRVPVAKQTIRQLRREAVTASYFAVLGLQAEAGRLFREEMEGGVNPPPVAVISYGLWQGEFGGRRDVAGETLRLGDVVHTVVGVAPAEFTGVDPAATSVWTPLRELVRDRGNYGAVNVIARLRPEVSMAQANQEANRANQQGIRADGLKGGEDVMQLGALPITQGPSAPREIRVSVWLSVAAALVLLAGWLNIAQLLTARAARRARETAIHLALGASRTRLIRQWISESLLLALLGGAAALGIMFVCTQLVYRLLLPDLPAPAARLGWRGLLVALALTVISGVLTGLGPAWLSLRGHLLADLKGTGRAGTNASHHWRSGLVMAQIALTVVVVVGAGLFVGSLNGVRRLDPGFDLDHLLVVHLDAQAIPGLSGEKLAALYDRLAARSRELPGIAAAGAAHTIPGESAWRTRFYLPGRDPLRFWEEGGGIVNRLSTFIEPGGMEALNLRLQRGRWFLETDQPTSEPVAIINEQLAREVWPQDDPLGRCLHLLRPDAPCTRVVGIVNNSRVENWFEAPPAQYYRPLAQPEREESASGLLVRATDRPEQVQAMVQQELQKLAPSLAFVEVKPLWLAVEPAVRPWRLGASVFGALAFLALIITAVGVFGLLYYSIAQRAPEWSIRQALGATPAGIASHVMGVSLRLALPGLMAGVVLARICSRWVSSLLFGLTVNDLAPYGLAACIVLLLALVATLVPCWRATHLNLAAQLREE